MGYMKPIKSQRKKNQNTVTAGTLAREPQPMRWNEITDGHWAEGCSTSEACYFNWIQRAPQDLSLLTALTFSFFQGRMMPSSFPVVKTNLMRYRRSRLHLSLKNLQPHPTVCSLCRQDSCSTAACFPGKAKYFLITYLASQPAAQAISISKGKQAPQPSGYADNEPGTENLIVLTLKTGTFQITFCIFSITKSQ